MIAVSHPIRPVRTRPLTVAGPQAYGRAAEASAHGAPEAGPMLLTDDWEGWFGAVSPGLDAFADHHEGAGAWLQAIERGARPVPRFDVWPRGHGKSTFAEHGVAYLGERGKRRFALYLCDTQDAANRHVMSVQTLLERIGEATGSPVGQRLESQYGHSRGWKPSQIRTASGFNVVALGFDVAMRGIKFDDVRPDLIIIDDVDGRHDTEGTTKKKVETLTESILPAGSSDCAVWGVQNLIIPNGIFSQLVDGRADFLASRIVNGPVKAVEGLRTEREYVEEYVGRDGVTRPVHRKIHVITGGEATWAGCDLRTCQDEIVDFGWTAFDREKQQNVQDVKGALWTTDSVNATRLTPAEFAELADTITRTLVSIDPASTSKGSSDETGILGGGRDAEGHGYVTDDESGTYKPSQWGRRAVLLHDRIGAEAVVIEGNQGGEMAVDVVVNAAKALHEQGLRDSAEIVVELVYASKGKRARAEPASQAYDEEAIHHVGDLPDLERQMTTWNAGDGGESPDRIDALVWLLAALGVLRDGPNLSSPF